MHEASGTAEPKHRPLGEGAAQAAPTAPHATPRVVKRRRNGPERFWSHWPVRFAFVVSLAVSSIVHCSVMPLPLRLPGSFEVKDMAGEALIPIDVLTASDLPPPPPPPPSLSPPPAEDDNRNEPAVPKARPEIVRANDAGSQDATPDAPPNRDAAAAPLAQVADAGPDSLHFDAASLATADAQAAAPLALAADGGGNGPRDPEGIVGSPSVRADVILVTLIVKAYAIRAHPVGPRIGRILRAIPQWDQFMTGTDIDPVRDLDWLMISGPSLRNTSSDSVLIHYSAPDAVVDRRIQIISRSYARGGPFDAGVGGVKASLIFADGAERVILRPQPHFLAVVPPKFAERNARALSVSLSEPHQTEAMFLRVVDPHHPMPEIPESITEMRTRVTPRADGGADVATDFDTKDPAAAADAAVEVRRWIRRRNDLFMSALTHGLLDHVEVFPDGSTVKVRMTATLDQIETMVTLVEDFLGVAQAPPAPPESSSAAPRSAPAPRRPR